MVESAVESSSELVVGLTEKTLIHVLHVDDDAGFLKVARQLMEMQGTFEVDTALSVEEAKEKLKKRFDVIVSDYQMPERDGLEFLKELRESGNGIPFIMFTGKGREEVAIEALNLGANRYINKFGDPETVYGELAHSIRQVMKVRKAEEALRESEGKLNAMLRSIGDHMSMMDRDLNILWANETAKKIFGNDIIGKKCYEVYHRREKPCEPYPCLTLKAFQDGQVHEHDTRVIGKDGKIIFFHCTANVALRDKEGKPTAVIEISRDITERKQAEEELKKSEERYRALLEETPVGIFNLDVKGKITYINKELEEITGYSRDEIQGKNVFSLIRKQGLMSDESLKLATKRMKNRFMGRTSGPLRLPLKRKDGSWIWIEGDSKLIKKLGFPVGLQSIIKDVTELKEAEESSKKLMEKLGVVGKLTRHDARNKLSVVTMNAFLIKQKLADDPEALEHLSEIESACGEIEKIFEFARIYEEMGLEELAYMNVEETFEETVRLFSDLHDVKVTNDCQGLTLLADSLLRQLFYNLIDNSLKHGEKVSQIRVHYEEDGKDKLRLVHEDDGIGVAKAEKEKIFREGYGKGSGYGLYLIRKMCEVYGWTIRETGKHGKGARFTITIPEMSVKGEKLYKLQK